MSYIKFDKQQLVNLEYSLNKELLRSNRSGAYSATTIVGCNTRKYHGLLIAPQPEVDGGIHVLLSSLDLTVVQHGEEFNLGIHKYPGTYRPKGHKYIRDFESDPIPIITYRVGGVVLTLERMFLQHLDRILVRYTLVEANSDTWIRLRPYLAFRERHMLSKQNMDINTSYKDITNGVSMRMYEGYSDLHMQFNKTPEYTHVPDWYKNIEYEEERKRGYEYIEDLYVPGTFELPLKKGESVIFSAGTSEIIPSSLKKYYNAELKRRTARNSFENCLLNSSQQFLFKEKDNTYIVAGYPWYDVWGRDSFISLPGIVLEGGNPNKATAIFDSLICKMRGPFFPNYLGSIAITYDSIDTSLWFFWALQKYAEKTNSRHSLWKKYGRVMKSILEAYREGTDYNIKMQDDGLLYGGHPDMALTWMNALDQGVPITPRNGLAVEVNSLWYNAIMFALEVGASDKEFVDQWKPIADKIPGAFFTTFWNPKLRCLYDYVNEDHISSDIRPNQLMATSLPFSPLDLHHQKLILDVIKKELVTPRGLRTLSPRNPDFEGVHEGNESDRAKSMHQGVAWPWLFGQFTEAYLKIHQQSGLSYIKKIAAGFEDEMKQDGIGTISELYDGNPPFKAGGGISKAWSVAEVLRVIKLIEEFENQQSPNRR